MKTALIVPSLEARHGGPSRSVRGLATGLARIGHAVELLSTAPGAGDKTHTEEGLSTHVFPRQWPQSFAPSAPLRHHLRSGDYDIVHHHGLWLRTLHYAHTAAAKSGAPLVISPRGMMSAWAWKHRRWKKIIASGLIHPGALSAAQGWHVTSQEESSDIRRLGFSQPVCVAPNGVTAPSAADEAAAAARWRELCPELTGRRVALFYSRLHGKKRVLELIDLWLATARNDWLLLLVGIPEEYSVVQLESYIRGERGSDRIRVYDGTHEPAPYAVASLFLLPSHSENFGLVVAEALVRGVPVLTTDTTPWSQLESIGAGRCVTWENYQPALAALLDESPESLKARGERARAWSETEFSWEKAARIVAAFYEKLRSVR
jgi:glycosyltransferase involved in cell wall biosynthesis